MPGIYTTFLSKIYRAYLTYIKQAYKEPKNIHSHDIYGAVTRV